MSAAVKVIVNGAAKGLATEEARAELGRLITDALNGAELVFTDEGANVAELARSAVREGASMIVAGGGDGTVNAVASALIGTETALGVLPLGTLNHFAKDLGMPVVVEEAVQVLGNGEVIAVDVGEVNGRIFINNSGLGLYPEIVHQREIQQEQGASKWPAALSATVRALLRYRILSIRVKVDGKMLVRRTPVVFVGNNEYSLEDVRLPTRKALDGGLLCLYIPHPDSAGKLLWFSLRALLGRPRPGDEFDMTLTDDFIIESRHRQLRVSLDGEVTRMATPLRFRVRPKALRVVVPRAEA